MICATDLAEIATLASPQDDRLGEAVEPAQQVRRPYLVEFHGPTAAAEAGGGFPLNKR
jgi:hypothetical protein